MLSMASIGVLLRSTKIFTRAIRVFLFRLECLAGWIQTVKRLSSALQKISLVVTRHNSVGILIYCKIYVVLIFKLVDSKTVSLEQTRSNARKEACLILAKSLIRSGVLERGSMPYYGAIRSPTTQTQYFPTPGAT